MFLAPHWLKETYFILMFIQFTLRATLFFELHSALFLYGSQSAVGFDPENLLEYIENDKLATFRCNLQHPIKRDKDINREGVNLIPLVSLIDLI